MLALNRLSRRDFRLRFARWLGTRLARGVRSSLSAALAFISLGLLPWLSSGLRFSLGL